MPFLPHYLVCINISEKTSIAKEPMYFENSLVLFAQCNKTWCFIFLKQGLYCSYVILI